MVLNGWYLQQSLKFWPAQHPLRYMIVIWMLGHWLALTMVAMSSDQMIPIYHLSYQPLHGLVGHLHALSHLAAVSYLPASLLVG